MNQEIFFKFLKLMNQDKNQDLQEKDEHERAREKEKLQKEDNLLTDLGNPNKVA